MNCREDLYENEHVQRGRNLPEALIRLIGDAGMVESNLQAEIPEYIRAERVG